jgi:hypothetical protein
VTDETDYLRLADHSLGVCPITRTPLGNTARLMARGGCWGLRMPTHHGSASAPSQRLKVLSSARPAAFRYRNNCMR